ncbi:MAG: hypothetical protein RL653_3146 [Pseudomonadota bacterium]|jgi:hypothetical protein
MNDVPLKTSRILFLAILNAQLLVPGILFAVRQPAPANANSAQTLTYVAVGMLVVVLALVQVVRGQVAAWMKENADTALAAVRDGKVPGRAHSLALMQAAALEMPALVAGVALFFGAPPALGAVPLTTVVLTLWVMPTAGALERMAQD